MEANKNECPIEGLALGLGLFLPIHHGPGLLDQLVRHGH